MSDCDIYEDLEEFDSKVELEKVTVKWKELQQQHHTVCSKLTALEKQYKTEVGTNKAMEFNFQSLLETARREIRRKDETIAELRRDKDNLAFRRSEAPLKCAKIKKKTKFTQTLNKPSSEIGVQVKLRGPNDPLYSKDRHNVQGIKRKMDEDRPTYSRERDSVHVDLSETNERQVRLQADEFTITERNAYIQDAMRGLDDNNVAASRNLVDVNAIKAIFTETLDKYLSQRGAQVDVNSNAEQHYPRDGVQVHLSETNERQLRIQGDGLDLQQNRREREHDNQGLPTERESDRLDLSGEQERSQSIKYNRIMPRDSLHNPEDIGRKIKENRPITSARQRNPRDVERERLSAERGSDPVDLGESNEREQPVHVDRANTSSTVRLSNRLDVKRRRIEDSLRNSPNRNNRSSPPRIRGDPETPRRSIASKTMKLALIRVSRNEINRFSNNSMI